MRYYGLSLVPAAVMGLFASGSSEITVDYKRKNLLDFQSLNYVSVGVKLIFHVWFGFGARSKRTLVAELTDGSHVRLNRQKSNEPMYSRVATTWIGVQNQSLEGRWTI